MTPLRKALVALLALALLGTVSLGAVGKAAAAQNAPSWSPGNQWVYSTKFATIAATLTMVVKGQTSLTIGSTTYSVWDVNVTTSVTTGGGSLSYWGDTWYTSDGASVAKTSSNFLVTSTATYDPPEPRYTFPLAPGTGWSGTSNVTTTTSGGTTTTPQSYSGTVTAEQTIVVPAGTFTTEVIRSPATGSSYRLDYYSDQVGNLVKTETYVAGALFTSQNLTSFSYSPGLFGISTTVWIVILVIALILIVASVVFLRRRPRAPYPMPPPQGQYPQPPYPPQQPPQQGPPGT